MPAIRSPTTSSHFFGEYSMDGVMSRFLQLRLMRRLREQHFWLDIQRVRQAVCLTQSNVVLIQSWVVL